MIEAILLTRPAPLWSTCFNVMPTPRANTEFCSFMQGAACISDLRIGSHNLRAGSKA
jgi:hypothetical protein